jgi:uncharacterized protein (TIGR00288 family)
MRFYPDEKLAVLVDGPNVCHAAKNIGLEIDWGKLQGFLSRQAHLVSSTYYTPLTQDQDGFQPVRKLVDWLDFNGWQTFTADTPPHVALAVNALELADQVDHFILATGNADFIPLVEALQRCGRRVTIVSALKSNCVAEDLRRAATNFLDLEAIREHVARAPRKEAANA